MKIKTATARVVYDRRKVASTTHDGSVEIEVSHNGKRKWLPTGVRVRKDQWYNKRGVFVTNRIDSNILNQRINNTVMRIQTVINVKGTAFVLSDLDIKEKESGSFLDFMREQIMLRNDLRPLTRRQHLVAYKFLEGYGKIVTFDDLTRKNIVLMDSYLHTLYSNQSTVQSYHKRIKTYVQRALEYEHITVNPYASIKIALGREGTIKYLTQDEVEKIADADIPSGYIGRARDLFIFQCYTGLAYADLASFDFAKAEKRSNGYFIRDGRIKTNEEYYLMILPKAMDVLAKYDYVLPVISNVKYNAYLKRVAAYAGLNKRLTSHMARHTFATMLLNNGIPVETAAKMLGHSQIRTTQRYAKVLAKTVEDAYIKLADIL